MPVAEPAHTPAPRFYLYVLECADGTWYTGYTVDVEERVRTHNAGLGAKYTRGRLPVRLVAQASFATKHEAMSAEFRFKRLSRRQKKRLVRRAEREPFEEVLRTIMPGPPAASALPADAARDLSTPAAHAACAQDDIGQGAAR